MGEFVTKEVHEEFMKRIEGENKMQDQRITALEAAVKNIVQISINVERLATNVEIMTKAIEKQGLRLAALEEKPAKRWDLVVTGIISALVGFVANAVFSGVLK